MRSVRLLVLVLAALTAAGCARRDAQLQYPYGQPVYQAQIPGYPQQAYPPPGYPAPAYPQPVYSPPVYQQTACPPACAPNYQAQAPYAPSGYAAYGAYSPAGYMQGYALDAGDRLRITVFGQQGLTNSYAVDASGIVTMPLVGPVSARGLTTDQLAQSIAERLRQGYIREPKVAIEVEAYRPFFIHGEVTTPGQYPYVANMTVENAIAIAGGFGPRADKRKVTLSRGVSGQQGVVGLNYPLRPGDILRVGERWF